MPIIYTPFIGTSVKRYSHEFRQTRGLFISYPQRSIMNELLGNRTLSDIDIIVVTDGEGVLGIGDQGIGGMDIPIGKLMVYSLAGAVNPLRTLPIILDVGTNNKKLLENDLYLGWRHDRLCGQTYLEFAEKFIRIVREQLPHVLLHWEDVSRENAAKLLELSKETCTFNDDIQGTGVITLAAVLSAVESTKLPLVEQRIVIYGAGNAGLGIAGQIIKGITRENVSHQTACEKLWLVDKDGLLIDDMTFRDTQKDYVKSRSAMIELGLTDEKINLASVVRIVKPTMLIGVSAQSGHFTEMIVKEMCKHVENPVIMPLSNPSNKSEANPQEILRWSKGKALIATGSPFNPVDMYGKKFVISQCNNALAFPGIGLGSICVKSSEITESMLYRASEAIAEMSPILLKVDPCLGLLPSINDLRDITRRVAIAVASQAVSEGVATDKQFSSVVECVDHAMWIPEYLPIKYRHP